MKQFLKITALFLAPVVLLLSVYGAGLWRSGELVPTERIEQAAKDGEMQLFGLAYRDDTRTFKNHMAAEKKAQLLVLGTSRSMQLRGEFFRTESFYNAGGGIAYLNQVQPFLENLPADARPAQLILVLDQYFYNDAWAGGGPADGREQNPYAEPQPAAAFQRMMSDHFGRKFSLWNVLNTQSGVYGLSAAANGAGFLPDGSYTYGRMRREKENFLDYEFRDTLSRISQGTNRFEYGEAPSETGLQQTRELLCFCRENGISVTAFLPPYAPAVWQTMEQSGSYGYIPAAFAQLQGIFAEYGFEIFDYTFLPETQDEQYIDGFHGSDRVYAHIASRLAGDSAALSGVIDGKAMQELFASPGDPLSVRAR